MKIDKTVLKDLCGIHKLQGFELFEKNIIRDFDSWETKCQGVRFMLDGIIYEAIEDPDDGYRSYCDDITITKEKPKYTFPDCEVICTMKTDDNGEHDVLIGTDANTRLVVFEIGTMYIDDYYPYCHFVYNPENMYHNR